jgi:ribosomal protein L7/L12
MVMALNKLSNEYAELLKFYNRIPKAVLAAIAVSFALKETEDNIELVEEQILKEWKILHENNIVPQSACVRTKATRKQTKTKLKKKIAEFNQKNKIILKGHGKKKICCIKTLREASEVIMGNGWDLRTAKEIAETPNKVIFSNLTNDQVKFVLDAFRKNNSDAELVVKKSKLTT